MSTPARLLTRAFEFEATDDKQHGDGRTLEGYAAVFDEPTEIDSWEGRFVETIARGAFRKTLREGEPVLQFDHGKDPRTGTVPIGSFQKLSEDDRGLSVQARLFDNPVVEPIRQAIEGRAIKGMSFRFRVTRDEWRDNVGKLLKGNEIDELLWHPGDRGPLQRTIKEVQLFELGPVVHPAYTSTTVGVRSLTEEDRKAIAAEYARTAAADEETRVSDKPWSQFSQADYTIEQWRRATLIAVKGSQSDNKEDYKLPVREPDGTLNRNGVHAAAQRIGQVEGVSPEKVRAAARKLVSHYRNDLNEDPPESLLSLAGMSSSKSDDTKSTDPEEASDAVPERGTSENTPAEPASVDAAHRGTSAPPEKQPAAKPASRKEQPPMADDRMTVEEREARKSEIKARLAEIDQEYSGAELPEDIQREWGELDEEFDAHERAIEAANVRRERLRSLAGDGEQGRTLRGSDTGRKSVRRPDNIYDLTEIRNMARSMDEVAQLYRDNAMRAAEQVKSYGNGVDRAKAQERLERLLCSVDDEQGNLARRILTTGSPQYERAFFKAVRNGGRGLTSEEDRALSLGVDAEGGFAVPFMLDPSVILTSDGVVNPLRRVARQVQIVGKEWQGITSAGITVSRAAESAEATDNSPTIAQPTVRAKKVHAFVELTQEIDQDWAALRSELTMMLNDAKETEEAAAFVTGDGLGENPSGVVNTLAASSEVAAGPAFTVSDLYALEEALGARFRARAAFLANKATYNKIRQFDTQGGADLWVRLGAGQPGELIGYPALESTEMTTDVSTAGSRYLLFGDFQQFLIVDRVGMSVELVPHLFGVNRRPVGKRGIYAMWRNSSKILVDNAFRVLEASA
ncbi:hypothetical protein GCM10012275_28330 [Longimycelium tulufanense]|uniref:Phage major capsid protein n=1 Tax=Longimycelium tulufanense TaxID=907463 RepID=A0A8J3FWS2_9PSEU|nr:phage major capsid protein [Longimycelium tulufanense]GGM55569.1 hypothetical protein GCM10012275_28330 [Longimycelium tulufanense]